jgi:hypothetical protein
LALGFRLGLHLLEHRKRDAVAGTAELFDLARIARLLRAKIIGREAQDYKTLIFVILPQLLEARVLGRKAALGRRVYHQHDFAFVFLKRLRLAIDGFGFKIKQGHRLLLNCFSGSRCGEHSGQKGESKHAGKML